MRVFISKSMAKYGKHLQMAIINNCDEEFCIKCISIYSFRGLILNLLNEMEYIYLFVYISYWIVYDEIACTFMFNIGIYQMYG